MKEALAGPATSSGEGIPVPTGRAVALLAFGLLPAVLAGLGAPARAWLVGWNLFVAAALAVDFLRAPRRASFEVERRMGDVLSSGVPNRVTLVLHAQRPVRGELRDVPPPAFASAHHRQAFALMDGRRTAECSYWVNPPARGHAAFGDLWVRLEGPWRLCARQLRYSQSQRVKVLPDVAALGKDALTLARAAQPGERAAPRTHEGRLFESLREYREGDPLRDVDWKASARRGTPVVREYRPEKNQPVLLVLDCGRQMAGLVRGRRKLDFAVDAALRLAKVGLSSGDAVGLLAFGREVLAHVPPRSGGVAQLRALTQALYPLEAELEESNYGRALERLFARQHRRSLVVVFSDLQDPHSGKALVERLVALRPRHLPLLVSLLDEDVSRAARSIPEDTAGAYVRPVAQALEGDTQRILAHLQAAGARIVRAAAEDIGPSTVRRYLALKDRGLV